MDDFIEVLRAHGQYDATGIHLPDVEATVSTPDGEPLAVVMLEQRVDRDTYAGFFGDIHDDPNITDKYTALCDRDAGTKGYQAAFDTWRGLGII